MIKKIQKNDILIKMDNDKIITIVIIVVAIIIVLAMFSGAGFDDGAPRFFGDSR